MIVLLIIGIIAGVLVWFLDSMIAHHNAPKLGLVLLWIGVLLTGYAIYHLWINP